MCLFSLFKYVVRFGCIGILAPWYPKADTFLKQGLARANVIEQRPHNKATTYIQRRHL